MRTRIPGRPDHAPRSTRSERRARRAYLAELSRRDQPVVGAPDQDLTIRDLIADTIATAGGRPDRRGTAPLARSRPIRGAR